MTFVGRGCLAGELADEDCDVGAAGDARACGDLFVDHVAVLCLVFGLPEEDQWLEARLRDRVRCRSLVLADDVWDGGRLCGARPGGDSDGHH